MTAVSNENGGHSDAEEHVEVELEGDSNDEGEVNGEASGKFIFAQFVNC